MELCSCTKYVILSFLLVQNIPWQLHGLSDSRLTVNISCSSNTKHEIPIGVILDMKSLFGQMIHSSIVMALSDFYSLNEEYKTRVVLHTRDSKREPLHTLSVALDLIENLEVQAILGPETPLEATFLSILGNKNEVPILSLASSSPSYNPASCRYFIQMTQDEMIQWKGLAAIAESFKWNNVIFVHEENTDFNRESIPYIMDCFRRRKIQVSYESVISPSETDDQILDELQKVSKFQEKVIIVHVSPPLAFRLLVHAKSIGLMIQGYAWVITEKTMNFFDPKELDEKVVESFQGVLGLKIHIPFSTQFLNFSRRCRREIFFNEPNIFNVLAYDAIYALAKAVERVENNGYSNAKMNVLEELLKVTFKGLSGEFNLVNGKSKAKPLEIVNVIGKGERRVGFWTEDDGIIKPNGLENVIWPGGLMTRPTHPRRQMLQNGKKLRIGVPILSGFEDFLHVTHNATNNLTSATGFCIDVFNASITGLPYEVMYEFVPFGEANKPQSSETYNELIYQVYLQTYDGAVGDTTITANRSLYVDFTIPYTDLGVGTVAIDHNHKDMWWFLEPLDTHMWVAMTCSFFVIGATIWAIEYPMNKEFQGPWQDVIGKVLWFSFSTLTFSHRAKLLSNLSRLLVMVWLFILLVMISCYNAALSSMLTVQKIELTKRGIDIGYQAGSFVEGVIVNNSNFNNPSIRPYTSLQEYSAALSKRGKKDGAYAIMDEFPYIKLFLAKYGDAYNLVSYEPNTNGFGFAFPKGSQLVHDLSTEISKLREKGELLKLEKKWFKKDSTFMPEVDPQTVNLPILTLDNFRGLFMLGGIFLGLVPFVFLIRFLYGYSFLIYYILINPRLALDLLYFL